MSQLLTFCEPCADKLCIQESLLPRLSVRPCAGCGTEIGEVFEPVKVDGGWIGWPTGKLVAPYVHVWQWSAWPIAWGLALQDNYGDHVHEWSPTYWSKGPPEVKEETCRCREKRRNGGKQHR